MSDELKFFTDGSAYERMMGRWSRTLGAKFIDWLAVPRNLKWLDVGCGNGAFTETLTELAGPAEVHGVDPSQDQIAYARSRKAASPSRLNVGAAEALPFPDHTFDAAVMALVIGFVDDPQKAVREMARVVRPGGVVAAYMWDRRGGQPGTPFRMAAQALGLPGRAPPSGPDVTQAGEMQALWAGAGLEAIEVCRISIDVRYDSLDDYWRSTTLLANPSVRFLRDLSPDDVVRVRAWLDQNMPRDAAGSIVFEAYANAVKGRVPP